MKHSNWLWSLFVLAVCTAGCTKTVAGEKLGEPIGVRVETSGATTLEAAFATKQTLDATPLVPAFATALGKAAKACPEVGKELGDNGVRLKGSLKGGKLAMEAPPADAPKSVVCVSKSLEGAELAPGAESPLVIELRIAKKEGAK